MNQVLSAGIALRDLHVGPYNPRRTVIQDPAWLEFRASIKAQGINQALLVRPVQGKNTPYEIVAGQRRFLAALEEFGPDYQPPILLKELTDEQAELASASENIDREDMSPAEEAEAAARVVARCKGDRVEAAKRLGWEESTLNNRLKLMACSEAVRKALSERKILLGVAELMAGLTHEKQDTVLADFLANGAPSLADAKTRIMLLTKQLKGAIFDQAECGACPNNSAMQKSMFGNIDDGHCMNAECFDRKTEAQLDATAASLKDEYQIVRIVRPGDNFSVAKLNPATVGETQAQACRNCAQFGAAVSGVPNKLGQVSRGLCFDTVCNSQKVSEHAASVAAAAKAEQEAAAAQAQAQATANPTQPVGESTENATASKPAAKQQAKTEKPEGPATVELTNAVHEYRDRLYRGVVQGEFGFHPERGAQFILALILANKRFDSASLEKPLTDKKLISDKSAHSLVERMKQVSAIEPATAQGMLPKLGAMAIANLDRSDLTAMVKYAKADLGKYFNLTTEAGKEFLKVLTKNQIIAICDELGISKAMGQTFRSLSAGKKDEFIAQVTSVKDFDYQGKVPNVLQPNFSK